METEAPLPCKQTLPRSSLMCQKEEGDSDLPSLICHTSKEMWESVQFRLVKPVFQLLCVINRHASSIFLGIYNSVSTALIPMIISSRCRFQKLVWQKPVNSSVKKDMAILKYKLPRVSEEMIPWLLVFARVFAVCFCFVVSRLLVIRD